MNLIKLIRTVFNQAIKLNKKPTLMTIFYEFAILFFTALRKQYKFIEPLLKLLRVLKIWTISTALFSLIYSGFSDLLGFTYDYRYFAAIAIAIGLLFKEFVYEYYLDIYGWFGRLFDRIINKLQNKVIETKNSGSVVNQSTVDKIKNIHRPNSDYLNI